MFFTLLIASSPKQWEECAWELRYLVLSPPPVTIGNSIHARSWQSPHKKAAVPIKERPLYLAFLGDYWAAASVTFRRM